MPKSNDKVVPFRRDEAATTVGGLVDESSASLCIYGEDLDPAQISDMLGAGPSTSFRRGHQTSRRSRPSPHGAWILEVRGEAPRGPEDLLRELLMRVPASREVWSELVNKYRVRIFIGIHMSGWNRGFSISPALLAQVAALGVEVDFDIYADGEEDDA